MYCAVGNMRVCGQCDTVVSDHEVGCANCGSRVMLEIGDEALGGYKGLMNERSSTIVSRIMPGSHRIQ